MRRVVRPGGKVAALVFSTVEKNPLSRHHVKRRSPFRKHPLPLFSLGETDVFENTFREGGLRNVTIRALSINKVISPPPERRSEG